MTKPTLSLTVIELSRLIWLIDREVHRLQKFSDDRAGQPEEEDDVAEAAEDHAFWSSLAKKLRECRVPPQTEAAE